MNTPLTVIQRTITYSPQVAAIRTWEDGISLGVIYAEDRDRLSWAIGELASYMRSSSVGGGRPAAGKKLSTLSAIADSLHMRREAISSMCANFEFYYPIRDRLPENCSWHDLSKARIGSGWRPETGEPTDEHRQRALDIACFVADRSQPRPRRTLADSLAAERERLAALAGRDEAWQIKVSLREIDILLGEAIEKLDDKNPPKNGMSKCRRCGQPMPKNEIRCLRCHP